MGQTDVEGFGVLPSSIVQSRQPGQRISLAEKRASLRILNDLARSVSYVRLDSGLYAQSACDYSASSNEDAPRGFLVELKGCHESDAVEQLSSTLVRLRSDGIRVTYVSAVLVPSGGALMPNAAFQKRQKSFWKATRTRLLRISKGNGGREVPFSFFVKKEGE